MHVKRRGIKNEASKFGSMGGVKQTLVLMRILRMTKTPIAEIFVNLSSHILKILGPYFEIDPNFSYNHEPPFLTATISTISLSYFPFHHLKILPNPSNTFSHLHVKLSYPRFQTNILKSQKQFEKFKCFKIHVQNKVI